MVKRKKGRPPVGIVKEYRTFFVAPMLPRDPTPDGKKDDDWGEPKR